MRDGTVQTPPAPPPARPPARSASPNARALTKRSPGSRSIARSTAASTSSGTLGRWPLMPRGVSVIMRATTASAVGPVNGGSPTSISYVTAPSA